MLRLAIPLAVGIVTSASPARGQCWTETGSENHPLGLAQTGFGEVAALDGDLAVVGHGQLGSSEVHVYSRQQVGAPWQYEAELIQSPTAQVAAGIDVSDDRVAVAIGGVVHLFERSQDWSQTHQVSPASGTTGESFGVAIALQGDRMAVGASTAVVQGLESAGAVYLFERDAASGSWIEVAKLTAEDQALAFEHLGGVLDLDGDRLIAGAPQFIGGPDGSARIFERDPQSGTWFEAALLQSASPEDYAASVGISGDLAVVGDPSADQPTGQQLPTVGGVQIFERDPSGTWALTQDLFLPSPSPWDFFGSSVALDGTTLVVGAPGRDNPSTEAGLVYVFERGVQGTGKWAKNETLRGSSLNAWDRFGTCVDLDGSTVLATSIDNGPQLGLMYSFDAPEVTAYCTAGTTASGCQAVISATGRASRAWSQGFDVTVDGVEAQSKGLLYFGTGGSKASAWGGGSSFQCVQAPFTRTGFQDSGGGASACDGSFQLDFNTWMASNPAKAPPAGATVWMQAWFRDPASTPTTSLSDGLHFGLCP